MRYSSNPVDTPTTRFQQPNDQYRVAIGIPTPCLITDPMARSSLIDATPRSYSPPAITQRIGMSPVQLQRDLRITGSSRDYELRSSFRHTSGP